MSTSRTKIDKQGRVVVPAEVREKLGLKPDTVVIPTLEDETLRIETVEHAVGSLRGRFKDLAPERIASEELIAERRAEAARE